MRTARSPSPTKERAVSGLAGASGGLGLVSIANSLPQRMSPIPALLIYASPFATVLISSIWTIGLVKSRRWLRRRSLEASLRSAIRLRDQVFANGESSLAIKKQAQSSVEKIQTLVMELILEDTKDTSTIIDLVPARIPGDSNVVLQRSGRESASVHNC